MNAAALTTLSGSLVAIPYHDELTHFGVYTLRDSAGDVHTVTGYLERPLFRDHLTVKGHVTLGLQDELFFTESTSQPPTGADDLAHYMSSLTDEPIARWVKVIARVGVDLIELIDRQPQRLCEHGFTREQAARVGKLWADLRADDFLEAQLEEMGVSERTYHRVRAALPVGENPLDAIRDDPFMIYLYDEKVSFAKARRVAASLGCEPTDSRSLRAALVAALRQALYTRGARSLTLEEAAARVQSLLNLSQAPATDVVIDLVGQLPGHLMTGDDIVALANIANSTLTLLRETRRLLGEAPSFDTAPTLDKAADFLAGTVPTEHVPAVHEVLDSSLSRRLHLWCAEDIQSQQVLLNALGAYLEPLRVSARLTAQTPSFLHHMRQGLSEYWHPLCIPLYDMAFPGSAPEASEDEAMPDLIVVVGADFVGSVEWTRLIERIGDETGILAVGARVAEPSNTAGDQFNTWLAGDEVPASDIDRALPWLKGPLASAAHDKAYPGTAEAFAPHEHVSWFSCTDEEIPGALTYLANRYTTQGLDISRAWQVCTLAQLTKQSVAEELKTVAALNEFLRPLHALGDTYKWKDLEFADGEKIFAAVTPEPWAPPCFMATRLYRGQGNALALRGPSLNKELPFADDLPIIRRGYCQPARYVHNQGYEYIALVIPEEHKDKLTIDIVHSLARAASQGLVVIGSVDAARRSNDDSED